MAEFHIQILSSRNNTSQTSASVLPGFPNTPEQSISRNDFYCFQEFVKHERQ